AVVVCAGLWSERLATAAGAPRQPRIVPFRGDFWVLRADRDALVRGMVYPVPDPALPFLGVHATRRADGEVWLGPTAVLALQRDDFVTWQRGPVLCVRNAPSPVATASLAIARLVVDRLGG